jgi:uncharacterized membrane protein
MSSLKNIFYLYIKDIDSKVNRDFNRDNILTKTGKIIKIVMLTFAFPIILTGFFIYGSSITAGESISTLLPLSTLIAGIFMFILAFFMPQDTKKGALLNHRIKGFKLYMETAEKYRQQFNEKENIFEKLLPYAIMFGITKKWANAMQSIYGQEYFSSYHPIWFVGLSMQDFDAKAFSSQISNLSSTMSTALGANPSASGAGGGGFSGGGGGGGGGGGW